MNCQNSMNWYLTFPAGALRIRADRCKRLSLIYRKLRKMFLSPKRESINPQPSQLWWDALTIDLSYHAGVRSQREGYTMTTVYGSYVTELQVISYICFVLIRVIQWSREI